MGLPVSNSEVDSIPANAALHAIIKSTYTSSVLQFYLNGRRVELQNPNPHWTLLDFIRSQRGLKGTKLGCGEGGCGACTVVLQVRDRSNSRRIKHLSVNACLYPLVGGEFVTFLAYFNSCTIDWVGFFSGFFVFLLTRGYPIVVGKHVITVEGLGSVDKPHPLQERMGKLHGSQ